MGGWLYKHENITNSASNSVEVGAGAELGKRKIRNRRWKLYMKKNKEQAFEARIANLEKRVNMFQTLILKGTMKNDGSNRCLEN